MTRIRIKYHDVYITLHGTFTSRKVIHVTGFLYTWNTVTLTLLGKASNHRRGPTDATGMRPMNVCLKLYTLLPTAGVHVLKKEWSSTGHVDVLHDTLCMCYMIYPTEYTCTTGDVFF